MSKGSAVIAIMIAFIGGFAIGNVTGGSGDGGEEVANVEVEPTEGAGGAAGAVAAADAPAAPADGIERFRIPVTDAQPQKGPADALVTIVEWSEFQCPFCNRVLPTVQQIQREYEGKVRFVWRDNPLPFHQNAKPAATLAREAFQQGGADKFWAAHDLLFENQRALERADLERYAQQLGLNMAEVRAALDNDEHARGITEDQQLASRVGARGTPNFFINGRQLTGAQPFARFKEVIDDEIRRAQALVDGGTPAAQVYASLTRNGRTQAAPAQPRQQQGGRPQPDPNAVYKVEIPGAHPQKGPDDALVTIVEFSDFECPFCGRVEPHGQRRSWRTYGRDVRVVWMNNPLPFHQNAGSGRASLRLRPTSSAATTAFWANARQDVREPAWSDARENLETLGAGNRSEHGAVPRRVRQRGAQGDHRDRSAALGAASLGATRAHQASLSTAATFEVRSPSSASRRSSTRSSPRLVALVQARNARVAQVYAATIRRTARPARRPSAVARARRRRQRGRPRTRIASTRSRSPATRLARARPTPPW